MPAERLPGEQRLLEVDRRARRQSPSVVSDSVSRETSAAKLPASSRVAVRQTPHDRDAAAGFDPGQRHVAGVEFQA